MPRRSKQDGTPREWLASGSWPSGEFRDDAPEAVAYAVAIATALEEALRGHSKSAVAADARIQRTVLYRILDGSTWPDSLSIAKLEIALSASLWPAKPPRLRRSRVNKAESTA